MWACARCTCATCSFKIGYSNGGACDWLISTLLSLLFQPHIFMLPVLKKHSVQNYLSCFYGIKLQNWCLKTSVEAPFTRLLWCRRGWSFACSAREQIPLNFLPLFHIGWFSCLKPLNFVFFWIDEWSPCRNFVCSRGEISGMQLRYSFDSICCNDFNTFLTDAIMVNSPRGYWLLITWILTHPVPVWRNCCYWCSSFSN